MPPLKSKSKPTLLWRDFLFIIHRLRYPQVQTTPSRSWFGFMRGVARTSLFLCVLFEVQHRQKLTCRCHPGSVDTRGLMSSECSYVSRGGLKLAAALDAFGIDPPGYVCADLGSNVGGFVDCLLQRGAKKVYAVDTGYGVLAYKLRIDPRVVVMERTNAMHVELPEVVDLITIDVAWTPQHRILPNAIRLSGLCGRIV